MNDDVCSGSNERSKRASRENKRCALIFYLMCDVSIFCVLTKHHAFVAETAVYGDVRCTREKSERSGLIVQARRA